MNAPFAQAWALLKADAYINMDSSAHDTTLRPQVEGGMHNAIGDFISSLPRYQGPRPDGPNYRRGGSIPRNWDEEHGNQRFTGVNVASLWNAINSALPNWPDWMKQEYFAERFGDFSAHEDVHGLTDGEISEWAARAVGGYPNNLARTYFGIPKGREEDFKTIRSLAQEYGAYTATEPERKDKAMREYKFAPYVTGEKDPADLHENRPLSRETLEALHNFKVYASPKY